MVSQLPPEVAYQLLQEQQRGTHRIPSLPPSIEVNQPQPQVLTSYDAISITITCVQRASCYKINTFNWVMRCLLSTPHDFNCWYVWIRTSMTCTCVLSCKETIDIVVIAIWVLVYIEPSVFVYSQYIIDLFASSTF